MVVFIKKNKNIILNCSIFSAINCNNTFCGCARISGKNNNNNNDNNNNNNNDTEDNVEKKKDEEFKKVKNNVINETLKEFNDKKQKLTKLNRQNELKITEQQIKDIKNMNDFKNIVYELNKLKIHNDPVKNVVLDPDNITNKPYIFIENASTEEEIAKNMLNFIKYINDDVFLFDNDPYEIFKNLSNENKLYTFIKYDPSMFTKYGNNQITIDYTYLQSNRCLLYIDKNTFSVKDSIKLEDITFENFKNESVLNPKKFENCYILCSNFEQGDIVEDIKNMDLKNDILTIFKKKTIID